MEYSEYSSNPTLLNLLKNRHQEGVRRRSSSRSIKRRRFDDEIVEYSLGLTGSSNIKNTRGKTHSSNEVPSVSSSQIVEPPSFSKVSVLDIKRRHNDKTISYKRKKGRQNPHQVTKNLGRWKATDDLALIIGVQQTNDLKTVYLGTKFSCHFTLPELEERWYALLYDQSISRLARTAMKNLHPDVVASVQDKALWGVQEEELLHTIHSTVLNPLEMCEELLNKNRHVFYPSRTSKSLLRHWSTLRMYHLLPDQKITPLPNSNIHPTILAFHEVETALQDAEYSEYDESINKEMKLAHRKSCHSIRRLENEVSRWQILVDSVTGVSGARDLDSQTLAVLRGRLVRYLVRSKEVIIGRAGKGFEVDVDLSLEGPAWKISRRQAILRMRNTGEFYLSSEGKRPIFVDGRPILPGMKTHLRNNAVVEIASLRFIFTINQDLLRIIHDEAVKLNVPP